MNPLRNCSYLPSNAVPVETAFATYRIIIDLAMVALLEDPAPDKGEVPPGFFSNSFQNFKLSSAALFHVSFFFQRRRRLRELLTCCGEHLAIRAEAAVQHTALVGGDVNVANQRRVAPDGE